MKILLGALWIQNFKGVSKFQLTIDGRNATIFGDNGTGKTTTFDAFKWLLTGKDSNDRAKFEVQPLDDHGENIHNLDTVVTGIFTVDGEKLELKKQLSEKWTRKRGSEEPSFDGYETAYWVNEVPVKAGEYEKHIAGLIDEKLLKLLTDPFYFNDNLKPEERRKMLMEICGDLDDSTVIDSDERLSKLTEILGNMTIDQYKKVLKERISDLEKAKADIKPRVDEQTRNLPDQEPDYAAIETELKSLQYHVEKLDEQIAKPNEQLQTRADMQQRIYDIRTRVVEIKREMDDAATAGIKDMLSEKSTLETERHKLDMEIRFNQGRVANCDQTIKVNEKSLVDLRTRWTAEDAKQFNATLAGQCSTCGQDIPQERLDAQYDEMKAKFDESKKVALAEISSDGKAIKSRTDMLRTEKEASEKIITENTARLQQIDARLAEIAKLTGDTEKPDYNANEEYAKLNAELAQVQSELDKPIEDIAADLKEEKKAIQEQIDSLKKTLALRETYQNTRDRIEELNKEFKKLSKQLNEYEGHRYLLDLFVTTKVNLLEDSINRCFKHVRYRLFEIQNNGGISEVCKTLINTNGKWVPWDDANHAGKVNGGIDIINTLVARKGISAPVFIDFAESTNQLIPTESQVIRLVVTKDNELKVEVEE